MILDSTNVSSAVNEMDELELNNLALETAVYVAESWTDVMVGISQDEFKAYVESGELQPMSEGALDTVKNWIKKVWEKVKAFFSKAVAKIRGWLGSSKGFYEKYKKEIEGGAGLVKEFKGYKYTGLDNAGDEVKKACESVKTVQNDDLVKEKGMEEALKKVYNAIAGVDNASDFHKAFVKKLRGSESKETLTIAASDLKALLYSDLSLKNLSNVLKANEISFSMFERLISTSQDQVADEHKRAFSKKISLVRSAIGIMTSCNSTIISISSERLSMYKSYASAAVQAYKKDQSKNESTDLEGGSWQEYLKEQGIEL
jgi:hypothetical protein|nr:MAG TPA: Picornaviridae P3A protein [Caudoviricetes sp.]